MVATTSVASAVATAVVVRVNKTEGRSVACVATIGVAAGVPLAASVSVALAGSPAVSDLDVAVTCEAVAVNSCAAVALPVILASTANVASEVFVALAARVAVASSALGFRARWVAIDAALRFLGVMAVAESRVGNTGVPCSDGDVMVGVGVAVAVALAVTLALGTRVEMGSAVNTSPESAARVASSAGRRVADDVSSAIDVNALSGIAVSDTAAKVSDGVNATVATEAMGTMPSANVADAVSLGAGLETDTELSRPVAGGVTVATVAGRSVTEDIALAAPVVVNREAIVSVSWP